MLTARCTFVVIVFAGFPVTAFDTATGHGDFMEAHPSIGHDDAVAMIAGGDTGYSH